VATNVPSKQRGRARGEKAPPRISFQLSRGDFRCHMRDIGYI